MDNNETKVKRILNGRRVLLPLGLSLLVALYLLRDFDFASFKQIQLNEVFFLGMFAAFCMAILRDVAYMWRLRILTEKQISWTSCFQIIMLWEFASAVTPSAVGGSLSAIYMLQKEKVPLGKSSSIILLAAFLDELIYILVLPILYLLLGEHLFQYSVNCDAAKELFLSSWFAQVKWIVIAIYIFLLLVYTVLYYGLFINASALKKAYHFLAQLKILRRWEASLHQAGEDIALASADYKNKPFRFWLQSSLSTFISWSARYLVAFFLVWAVSGLLPNIIEVYGRQYFIRTLTILPLSPGGVGVAEVAFVALLCAYMPAQLTKICALLWRVLSYHIYLLMGMLVLPIWLAKHQDKKQELS